MMDAVSRRGVQDAVEAAVCVHSLTPWPTSPSTAIMPNSADQPKHIWANTDEGLSHPVPVPLGVDYEVPKALDDRANKYLPLSPLQQHTFAFDAATAAAADDEQRSKVVVKSSLTPSLEAMDINDKSVQSDGQAAPSFSLSQAVDWKPRAHTSSESSGPITPQDSVPFSPSYLEKRPARQSSHDTASEYSSAPPAFRVIRGPGSTPSSSTPPPTIKSHPRRRPDIEPSLSRSGSSRRAAERSRIAIQKAQQESDEDEDWPDDDDDEVGEDEVDDDDDDDDEDDELRSSSPAKPRPKLKIGQDDGTYDLDDDDAPGPIMNVPRKRGRPPNSSLLNGKRRKTGDRYPCTVQGCSKTFTRRNDVERHIKSSGAHPEIKIIDESKRCKHCGTDLSRADARLRHERTNACGKRNLQQSRVKMPPSIAASISAPVPKARVKA